MTLMVPVRVRGKKYRKKPVIWKDASSRKDRVYVEESQIQRKKQILDPETPSSSQKRFRSQHDTATSDSVPQVSQLEQLPVEIIELIFFQCLNLGLPRASPLLGKKLGSNQIKTELFATAFNFELTGSPSGTKHVTEKLKNSNFLINILGTLDAVAVLQSQILALRWMTLDLLKAMIERSTIATITKILDKGPVASGHGVDLQAFFENRGDQCRRVAMDEAYSLYVHFASHCDESRPVERWQILKWPDGAAEKRIDLYINVKDGRIGAVYLDLSQKQMVFNYRFGFLFCLPRCWIPHKLLTGPWSVMKCELLDRILRGNGRIACTENRTDEEIAAVGLQDAILEDSLWAIQLLAGWASNYQDRAEMICNLCPWRREQCYTFCTRSFDSGVWSCAKCLKPFWLDACDRRRFGAGITVTTSHFKLALDKECSLKILMGLAGASNVEVDWQHDDFIGWAIQKRKERDSRGGWLLHQIEEDINDKLIREKRTSIM